VGDDYVLVLDPGDPAIEQVARELYGEVDVDIVGTIADAHAKLGERRPTIVVAALQLADGSGLDFLRACAAQYPAVSRFLMASYGDLPELVRTNAGDVVPSVLPKPVHAPRMATTLREMLRSGRRAGGDSTRELPASLRPFDWKDAARILRETLDDALGLPGIVVRQLPVREGDTHLELVVRTGDPFGRFHCTLPGRWGWPMKESHQQMRARDAAHPVLHVVGELGRGQEVYARTLDGPIHEPGGSAYVYLALLPWRRRKKTTLVLGVLSTDAKGQPLARAPEARRIVEMLHARAIAEVPAYYLPRPDAHGKGEFRVRYVQEYDWVATEHYVGIDRRKEPTTFLNAHVGRGARKHLPAAIAELSGGFVDRFPPQVLGWVGAYLVFAAFDTLLTWWFVSNGTVGELNPLLRPLIGAHPWSFVLLKNAISTATILVIARFHLFRAGKLLLPLNVAMYASLDAYWLWLLVVRTR
jgi:ActR/RegA family two-component response regulator